MPSLTAKLKIESWDEKTHRELSAEGSKITRADVTLSRAGEALNSGSFDALMFYRPDGSSAYVALIELSATLEGRSGTFVLQGRGSYDGTTARSTLTIVPGSGTDELAGISGTAESVSTHADYPHMPLTLDYELP